MARKESDHAVTMRDVAEDAGVSVKTVSNVVNNYQFVSARTRDKVMASIDKLGYTLNMTARNLRTGHTGIIGLAVPDLVMPYFAQLSSLVIGEAKKLGMRVIVEPTLYSREGELEALHGAQQAMLDGLIFSPLELGQDDVAELDVDYPLVLIGERIFTDTVDHVATENVEGAKRATKYLLQTGCRRLAVVGTHPGEQVGSAALRLQGYREALEEMGVPYDERLVVPSKMWHRDDGLHAMNMLLDSGVVPDGVVALNDMLASGVMHSIQLHGFRVPDDISVIGFDQFRRFAIPDPVADHHRPRSGGCGAAVREGRCATGSTASRRSVPPKAPRCSARYPPRWWCATPHARSPTAACGCSRTVGGCACRA